MSHLLTIVGSKDLIGNAEEQISMLSEGSLVFLENDRQVIDVPDLLAAYEGQMEGPHLCGDQSTLTLLVRNGAYIEIESSFESLTCLNLYPLGRKNNLGIFRSPKLKRPIKKAIQLSGIPIISTNRINGKRNQRPMATRYHASEVYTDVDGQLVRRIASRLKESYLECLNKNL